VGPSGYHNRRVVEKIVGMNIHDYIESLPNFDQLGTPDKFRAIAWYLLQHGNREVFSLGDLETCFKDAHYPVPQHLPAEAAGLTRSSPVFLIPKGPGMYEISWQGRKECQSKFGPKPSTIAVDKQLTDLLPKLTDADERSYLEEALKCFRIEAYRAAIVMTWTVAYDRLCKVILNKKLGEFNSHLPNNRKPISKREDFAVWRESEVLAVARSADIINKPAHKIWTHRLEDRNNAAHPNKVIFIQLEVEAFIHNLIENCVLPLSP